MKIIEFIKNHCIEIFFGLFITYVVYEYNKDMKKRSQRVIINNKKMINNKEIKKEQMQNIHYEKPYEDEVIYSDSEKTDSDNKVCLGDNCMTHDKLNEIMGKNKKYSSNNNFIMKEEVDKMLESMSEDEISFENKIEI